MTFQQFGENLGIILEHLLFFAPSFGVAGLLLYSAVKAQGGPQWPWND